MLVLEESGQEMLIGERGYVSTKGICKFQDRLASEYVTCEVG